VQLTSEPAQLEFALSDSRQAMLTLRGEPTLRYDSRICDGSGSGGSLNSSSQQRIVCSVADKYGNTWSLESSSPREMYYYLMLQMCGSGNGIASMMTHSQYAATFACQPADPKSPLNPGALVEHLATP